MIIWLIRICLLPPTQSAEPFFPARGHIHTTYKLLKWSCDELQRGNFVVYRPCRVASFTEDLVLYLVLLLHLVLLHKRLAFEMVQMVATHLEFLQVGVEACCGLPFFQEQPKPRTEGKYFIQELSHLYLHWTLCQLMDITKDSFNYRLEPMNQSLSEFIFSKYDQTIE